MNAPVPVDATERNWVLRMFYRGWRPTWLGRWVNRLAGWWSIHGTSSSEAAVLEVRGGTSGKRRSLPVVIATVAGKRYLVSMLGDGSDWVKNVEAAHGDAVLHQQGRWPIHLARIPPRERAPVLSEYVRVATSGRRHFPVAVGAPLPEFEMIAERYPVYRIDAS